MTRRFSAFLALLLSWYFFLPFATAQSRPPDEEAQSSAVEGEPLPAESPAEESDEGEAVVEELQGKITFELPFPEDKGGGSATGWAGSMEFVEDERAVLTGGVKLVYQDIEVRAERVEVDLTTKQLFAEGDVIVDQGPRRLAGETAEFDLESKTGKLTEASGHVAADFFFSGDEVAKIGLDTYTVKNGMFTSCDQEVPNWSFRLGTARVEVEGMARVHHARMEAKKVPFFYFPYLIWPARSERSSGMLVPNFGFSRRRGTYLGLAYYQVLGPSYDTTFFLDLYSKDYAGAGSEFRYRPSEGTQGILQAYAIDDPEAGEVRWKASWKHETRNLFKGMRAVVQYEDFSDFNFFLDFERRLDRNSQRSLYSNGFLSGNWGVHSLNIMVDNRETFLRSDSVISQRQLPEIEYKLRPMRLGNTPLYLQMQSSLHYLEVTRSATYQGDYGRADLFPQLTLPLSSWPWLSLSVSAGGRVTWYGDTVNENGNAFSGESLTRTFPVANAEIVGPSFSRIFNAKMGRFGKFKHVIEPRFTYGFIDEFEDQDLVPLFDEIDRLRPANLGRFSLINRLLAKPADGEGGAMEILSLEIAQSYSLDDDRPLQRSSDGTLTSQKGPLGLLLRYNPSTRSSLRIDTFYNTLFGRMESAALSGTYGIGSHNIGVRWTTRMRPEDGETLTNQARLALGIQLIRDRLRLESQLSYDFENRLMQQQRYILKYDSSCYGLRLELVEIESSTRLDREFRFAVSLKNVGTFLDFTGGDSETF